MSNLSVRLQATAQCLMLDRQRGPVACALGALRVGDAVLVEADGEMDFRPVTQIAPATAPGKIALLPRDSLGPDRPMADLLLAAGQSLALPGAQSEPIPAAQICLPAPAIPADSTQDLPGWVRLELAGAARIVIDGIGMLLADDTQPNAGLGGITALAALRAFAGQQELPLLAADPLPGGASLRFSVPPRTAALRLTSQTFSPDGEFRQLGVALLRLAVEEDEIGLDNPGLVRGFYPVERNQDTAWRWTDGEALLLLPPRAVPQMLELCIADWHAAQDRA